MPINKKRAYKSVFTMAAALRRLFGFVFCNRFFDLRIVSWIYVTVNGFSGYVVVFYIAALIAPVFSFVNVFSSSCHIRSSPVLTVFCDGKSSRNIVHFAENVVKHLIFGYFCDILIISSSVVWNKTAAELSDIADFGTPLNIMFKDPEFQSRFFIACQIPWQSPKTRV